VVAFDYLLSTATVNVSLLKQLGMKKNKRKRYGIAMTRYHIAQQLLLPHLEKKTQADSDSVDAEPGLQLLDHFPKEIGPGIRRNCVQCWAQRVPTKSWYWCLACEACLCVLCFESFHRLKHN